MKLKKLFEDLKRCKPIRKNYRLKMTVRFEVDTHDYYFAFLPTVLFLPWPYRSTTADGVIDIWWLNMHILIGRWERAENA